MQTATRRQAPARAALPRLKACAMVSLIITALATAVLCILALLALVLTLEDRAHARDIGQWQAGDPKIREWYQSLMQPDVPTASCCGEADAYWADEIHVRDGKTYAVITDDRPDGPRGRPHLDVGTEIEIPNNKLKWDKGNPVGHNVVFLSGRRDPSSSRIRTHSNIKPRIARSARSCSRLEEPLHRSPSDHRTLAIDTVKSMAPTGYIGAISRQVFPEVRFTAAPSRARSTLNCG